MINVRHVLLPMCSLFNCDKELFFFHWQTFYYEFFCILSIIAFFRINCSVAVLRERVNALSVCISLLLLFSLLLHGHYEENEDKDE